MALFFFAFSVVAGMFGFWSAYSIAVKRNYRFVSNESYTPLPYPEAVAPRFAACFAFGGLGFLALPFLLVHHGVPSSRWFYPFMGLLGVIVAWHHVLISGYRRQYSPLMNAQRPSRGIFYSHTDISAFRDTVYILDFDQSEAHQYGTIGDPTKDKALSYEMSKLTLSAPMLKQAHKLYEDLLTRSFPQASDEAFPEFWSLELFDKRRLKLESGKGRPKGSLMELHSMLVKAFEEKREMAVGAANHL